MALIKRTTGVRFFLDNTVQVDIFQYPIPSSSQKAPAESQQPDISSPSSDEHSDPTSLTDSEAVVGSDEFVVNESFVNSSLINTMPSLPSSIYNVQRPLAGGIPLRIMCLGASVIRGAVSIGNIGFRYSSRTKLAALGNPINYVGSQLLGAFKDNDLEAFAGNRIDQIHAHAEQSKHDTGNAYKRYRDFVTYLLSTSTRATIIISSLLTNTVPSKEPFILDVNLQIRRLASELQREGERVVFAEMQCEQGYPDRPVAADTLLTIPEQNGIPEDGEFERINEPLFFEPSPPKKPRPEPQPASTPPENKEKAENAAVTKAGATVDTKTGPIGDDKAGNTTDTATVINPDTKTGDLVESSNTTTTGRGILYPSVVLITKVCEESETIQVQDHKAKTMKMHTLPAGCRVYLSSPGVNYHPQYWEDPEELRPERWLTDKFSYAGDKAAHHGKQAAAVDKNRQMRGTLLTFSDWGRACLGRKFAQVEYMAFLAVLLRRFRVTFADGVDVKLAKGNLANKCAGQLTPTPLEGSRLKLVPRPTQATT
ncbi:cytochrome P450 [Xylariaceae sp. AK1471]|nr:cytochrome P450 [Xylariaceae sp. AK1471]